MEGMGGGGGGGGGRSMQMIKNFTPANNVFLSFCQSWIKHVS